MKKTAAAIVLLALPSLAAAQAAPPAPRGPLVLERLEYRFVIAPDYKVTEIDGDTGQLAGGYAGWLAEDTLLIGGAFYTLTNGPDDAELTYGGLLIGWSTPAEQRFQFGARGLLGVGRAEIGREFAGFGRPELARDMRGFARFGSRPRGPAPLAEPTTVRVIGEDDFFVFEPQLTLTAKLSRHVGITVGGGYRLTGYTEFADDRLRGATGSLALQLALAR